MRKFHTLAKQGYPAIEIYFEARNGLRFMAKIDGVQLESSDIQLLETAIMEHLDNRYTLDQQDVARVRIGSRGIIFEFHQVALMENGTVLLDGDSRNSMASFHKISGKEPAKTVSDLLPQVRDYFDGFQVYFLSTDKIKRDLETLGRLQETAHDNIEQRNLNYLAEVVGKRMNSKEVLDKISEMRSRNET